MAAFLRWWALQAMESPWFVRALGATRDRACATILMHRFDASESNRGRHTPATLRRLLQSLKSAGIAFVDLQTAVGYCSGSPSSSPRLAVSFTVDDGYADFASLAWPVFREFDCPVSLFVVPDVVAGRDWFWWDKLDWIMRHTPARRVSFTVGDRQFAEEWHDEVSLIKAHDRLCTFAKALPTETMRGVISRICDEARLALPVAAPEAYQVLSWDELRSLEQEGLRIGPHTMTHPVLSRCDDARSRSEIIDSVAALRRELKSPLPIFCYPNGRVEDQGEREWAAVRDAGLSYAITTTAGLMEPSLQRAVGKHWALRLPRIGFDEHAGRIIREFVS